MKKQKPEKSSWMSNHDDRGDHGHDEHDGHVDDDGSPQQLNKKVASKKFSPWICMIVLYFS